MFLEIVSSKTATTHIFQSGVRNWPESVSQRQIKVFYPQTWDSHLRRESCRYTVCLYNGQNNRSDEGLTLETSAFDSFIRWPIHIINTVDKTNLPCYTSHRRSTTVSLESYPSIQNNTWLLVEMVYQLNISLLRYRVKPSKRYSMWRAQAWGGSRGGRTPYMRWKMGKIALIRAVSDKKFSGQTLPTSILTWKEQK